MSCTHVKLVPDILDCCWTVEAEFLQSSVVRAVVAVDAPRDFAMAFKLVEGGARIPPEALRDQGISLRDIARSTQVG